MWAGGISVDMNGHPQGLLVRSLIRLNTVFQHAIYNSTFRFPTSGSFMRVHKVHTGRAFLTALQERYGLIDDQNAGIEQEEMFVRGTRHQKTTVEVVGAKSVNIKQR